jgi:outer membrane protein assembly factor BamA
MPRSPACADRLAGRPLAGLLVALACLLGGALAPARPAAAPPPVAAPPAERELPDDADISPPGLPEAPEAPEPLEAPPPPSASATSGRLPGATSERCALEAGPTDPLAPLDAALEELTLAGFRVGPRDTSRDLRGLACSTTLDGSPSSGPIPPSQGLLHYLFERLATDGYVLILIPTGPRTLELIARPSPGGDERGLLLAGVDRISIDGTFREGDNAQRLEEILDLGPGTQSPTWLAAKLAQLGYRSELLPVAAGEIIVQVEPGRSIRRVRVHGHIPLSKRDLQRELSVAARPGALAYGRCAEPRREPAPICDDTDRACKQWEADELARLSRFFFDRGYLKGSARLALICGRAADEADLHIHVTKGEAYRVARKDITLKGTPTEDQRWLRRVFLPRVKSTPFPSRITRDHVEGAIERTERRYAEPSAKLVTSSASQRSLDLPYPEVQVTTSYQDLTPATVPDGDEVPLDVTVDLGRGVRASFIGANAFSKKRLLAELSLFRRRESPSAQLALREAANLRAFLQSKGYLLATVQGRYEEFGSQAPGQLFFVLSQGPKVTIRDVELRVGAGVPPEVARDIRRQYQRARKLQPRGAFSEAVVLDDLNAVIAAYNDRGYPCAAAEVSVAFWRDGHNHPGEHATPDLETILLRPTAPTWAERDFAPAGLAAIRQRDRAPLYVRITVEPGPRVFTARRAEQLRYLEVPIPPDREVSDLPLAEEGQWGERRILYRSALRPDDAQRPGGVSISTNLDRDIEQRIVDNYQSSGYPLADAELRWVYKHPRTGERHSAPQIRRLTDPAVGMCAAHTSGTAVELDVELSVYEGRRGRFGDTLYRGNFKTRDYVLRREIDFREGDEYSRRQVTDAQVEIDGTGVASAVEITPYPVGCELDSVKEECVVHHIVDLREAKDVAFNLAWGAGLATLDPFYVFVRPSLPNLFGTAWDLDINGHFGFDTSGLPPGVPLLGDCAGQRCYERSARASLSRQRIFGSPLGVQISGQIQQRLTPARGAIVSALGSLGITYPITPRLQTYFGYLIQRSNISKDVVKPTVSGEGWIINRRDAIVSDRTGALQSGLTYTNVQDNPFNPEDGFIAGVDLLLASPYLGGLDWWARAELSWQHFIPLPGFDNRLSLRYALRYGHAVPIAGLPGATTTSIPEVWRYFGGGTVDLGLRGVAPETMLVDVEVIDQGNGVQRLSYTAQGGHIRALGTFALQVVSLRDFLGGKLAHALFVDLGILTQRWEHVHLARDLRRSVGINFIKWDIKIVTAALGYAILVPNWLAPGNVHPTDDRNGRLVFDVGITF